MEIWIRSQSREALIKVQGLRIDDYKGKLNETDEVVIEDVDTYTVLGEYPKERAIEVLDEVQRYINLHKAMKFDIYEMPEK